MSLGIDAKRVYAEDGNANPAFWTVFTEHPHAQIVQVLKADIAVQVAIKAKLDAPPDNSKHGFLVDIVNRMTVNCIGQHIAGQGLHPEKGSFTVYNLLDRGTAAAIDEVISAPENKKLHEAFAAKDADAIIDVISRQTGRALFQMCLLQLVRLDVNPTNLIDKLKDALLHATEGIVPRIG